MSQVEDGTIDITVEDLPSFLYEAYNAELPELQMRSHFELFPVRTFLIKIYGNIKYIEGKKAGILACMNM